MAFFFVVFRIKFAVEAEVSCEKQEDNFPHANIGATSVPVIKKQLWHHLQISKTRRIKTFRRAILQTFDSSE